MKVYKINFKDLTYKILYLNLEDEKLLHSNNIISKNNRERKFSINYTYRHKVNIQHYKKFFHATETCSTPFLSTVVTIEHFELCFCIQQRCQQFIEYKVS